MWGYIIKGAKTHAQKRVPSLYVRVYRPFIFSHLPLASSLIICEGISEVRAYSVCSCPFPHYMWGYIGSRWMTCGHPWVPSLYVRVYRRESNGYYCKNCSLIICEGISTGRIQPGNVVQFPHYMWGYIGLRKAVKPLKRVPSLYVRVYRTHIVRDKKTGSSLIICEGISPTPIPTFSLASFPHYMWGYIGCTSLNWWASAVPSLYVRVYRRSI